MIVLTANAWFNYRDYGFVGEIAKIVIAFLSQNRTQDSGHRTGLFDTKLHLEILHQEYIANSTIILNKYGPDIIKNAEMHVGYLY